MQRPLSDDFVIDVMAENADGNSWQALAFDCVYSFLVSINQLLHKGFKDHEIKGELLLKELRNVSFTGVPGP